MSEYAYYEFQALDRPLTEAQMRELRSYSTRATITATRFVNHYEWGSFKGDPSAWMEKYFDAFVHIANWGTHELMIRLPRQVLDLRTAKRYCRGETASARSKSDSVILTFLSEDEDSGDWDNGSGWLASLVPLRADIAAGDHRALYLAWLLCVQVGEVADHATEPSVPPGLSELSAPLKTFADFLRLDADLIAVAAARSPRIDAPPSHTDIEHWIASLPGDLKTDWLVRLAVGRELHLRSDLLRRFRETKRSTPTHGTAQRTVGDLLVAAEQRAEKWRRQEAERAAAERVRREREAAVARERYLAKLARREVETWRRVDELIATRRPGDYDEAVKHLRDLRDLAVRDGLASEVEARLLRLREMHSRKPSFIARLKKAGLAIL